MLIHEYIYMTVMQDLEKIFDGVIEVDGSCKMDSAINIFLFYFLLDKEIFILVLLTSCVSHFFIIIQISL